MSKQANRVQPHAQHDPKEFEKRTDIARRKKDRKISEDRRQARAELTLAEQQAVLDLDSESSD